MIQNRHYLRALIACCVTISLVLFVLYYQQSDAFTNTPTPSGGELANKAGNARSQNDDQSVTCKFPVLDPFDPAIEEYWETKPAFNCAKIQPDMTYLDSDGLLHLNATELPPNTTCKFQAFERAKIGGDSTYTYAETKLLQIGVPEDIGSMDQVEVKCTNSDGMIVYFNLHAHPSINKLKTKAKQDEEHLSVLMFWQDSVSLSMFRRNLPKSYAFMTDVLGMHVMKGFTKVADNTRPNVFTALTGLRWRKQDNDMPDELSPFMVHPTHTYYDNLPMIFKNYSAAGYATSFIEDKTSMGLFHYISSGFEKNPDFFTHFFLPVHESQR